MSKQGSTQDTNRMREWRAQHPDRAKRAAKRDAARISAALRLARQHPDLFAPLYEVECAKRGVSPLSPHETRGRKP